MTRQEYNRGILSILSKMVEEYPDLRFGQILINTDALPGTIDYYGQFKVSDPFYEEPNKTLERMSNNKNVEILFNKQYIESILYEVN